MGALARGPVAGKGGGDRQVGRKVVFVAVGCFLFFLVCLLSSRQDVTVILDARKCRRVIFSEYVRPQQLGESHGHMNSEQRNDDDMASTERSLFANLFLREAVIGGNTNDVVERDAAPEEEQRKSKAAAASNSDEQAEHAGNITFTTRADSVAQQRQPLCDFSGHRSDVCDLTGDVRMDANASAFIVVVAPADVKDARPTAYKIRPYARKGDVTSMSRVTELTVRTAAAGDEPAPPRCTATHDEPAVVFSIGGYTGNLFHDFTDVLVPLYATAQRYAGDVRLVVADARRSPRWWLAKYAALLRGLSRHPPLDLAGVAAAGEVHCFRRAVVGLRAHRELMIERERSDLDAVGMPEFTRFLRRALSLPRNAPTRLAAGDKKPRLLIVSRRGTRLLLNTDAVVRAAEEVGFEVVVSELSSMASTDGDDDVAHVGRVINSFDAMVGVHGADLTNMVFLPEGATMVQIVPWGGLQWIARLDFGDPAEAMGLRYIQYEIGVHESTLKDKYPRGHEIFTNPTALHKKGFKFLRDTFLKGQDIIVDVERFRTALLQALENLKQ
ncbi:hypothetical protein HU200_020909 [Digitaria exilis]|uniref:Glycosyltransferase 61 catalytic domain-containing protein n=1 Tax=Digitaria exilis TaxID=1010633 RepID=A0A835KCB0_9POAL|nr:hypothetical protein HU200_020909 [Digitaria exilis]